MDISFNVFKIRKRSYRQEQTLQKFEILDLGTMFETAMVSCSRFSWIRYSSDTERFEMATFYMNLVT